MMKKGNKVGDSSALKNVNKKADTESSVPKEVDKKGSKVGDGNVVKEGGLKSPVNIQIEVTNASTPSNASHEDLLHIGQGQKRETIKDGIVNPVFTTEGEIIKTNSTNPDEPPKHDILKNAERFTEPDRVNHDIHNSDGLLDPNIHINPDGLIDPNGPNDLDTLNELENSIVPDGLVNPVFSIETASDTSKSNTPERVPSLFSFSDNDVNQFNQQLEGSKQYLTPPCKGSRSTTSSGLTVPDVTGSRRPSDPLTFVQDDNFSQLQPLTVSNGLSKSEGRLPPLSPGYLTPCPYDRFQPPHSPGLLSTNSAWSELAKLHSRRSSYGDYTEDRTNSNSLSVVSSSLSEHLHQLVRAFSSRTERVKETTIQPPTPSSQDEYDTYSDANSAISAMEEPEQRQHRLDSFIPEHLRERGPLGQSDDDTLDEYFLECGRCKTRLPMWLKNMCTLPRTLEPQSKLYMTWLFLVTLCFMYNAWVIPLRGIFPYQNPTNLIYWLICDYTCDAIYILDILLVKPHLTYLNSGIAETNPKLMRKNYMQKRMFKFDVLSLLPLDLFYLLWGVVPWFRLPRLFKIQTFWEFYQRCDQAVKSAHVLRIIKTMTYMLFLIHLETCGYYAVSKYEGIGSNRWVYNGEGIAYIRCFYLATKTATSIGNNPIPTNTLEYIFMTIYWVSGVFVFALLIGQIRDIVDAAGRVKAQYDKMMDDALRYVKNLNCPNETQQKVRTWFLYQWEQQKISDEKKLMDWLPKILRTDLAIHVHFNTLSKVTLFQDCDKTLLFDLVLKLKPILYLPGEYVCKKGEVGKEMYIVSQGQVEVVGGPDGSTVLATLKEGSVFGEISLLAIAADGNRRTADVRCKGFTNLFILSQTEFEDAMAEYPEAHNLLKKRAKKLLRQNAKLSTKSHGSTGSSKVGVEPIIRTPTRDTETPKLFKTVLQMIDPGSSVAKRLGSYSSDPKDSVAVENITETTRLDQIADKPLPDADEAEDFYSKMLETELMDQETFEAMTNEAEKKQLQRNDTLNTDPSVDSTDSGVQMPKVTSPTESIGKTTSNKDSKESFVSSELNGNFEETCNWVIKQALSTPQVEKTRRHSRVEDEAQVKKIVEVLTKQNRVIGVNRKDEVELMSSFFEDNDPSENVDKVQQVTDERDSGKKSEIGHVVEKCGVDKDGKIEQTTKDVIPAKDQIEKNVPFANQVDDKTPGMPVVLSEDGKKSDNSVGVLVKCDQDVRGNATSNSGGNATSNSGLGNATSNSGGGNATSNVGMANTTRNIVVNKVTNNNGTGTTKSNNSTVKTLSNSGITTTRSNNSTVKTTSNSGITTTRSNNSTVKTTSNNGGGNTKSNSSANKTTSNNSGGNTKSNSGANTTTSNIGGGNTKSNSGANKTTSNNGGRNTKSNSGANKATSSNGTVKATTDNGGSNTPGSNGAIKAMSSNGSDVSKAKINNVTVMEANHVAVGHIDTDIPMTESLPRNIPPSSTSISRISRKYDQNNEILSNSLNSDTSQRKFVADQGQRSPGEQPKGVQMNGIPLQNQITCSVEIHREKSLTPVSLKDWIDGAKPRTESISSIPKEITLQESSV